MSFLTDYVPYVPTVIINGILLTTIIIIIRTKIMQSKTNTEQQVDIPKNNYKYVCDPNYFCSVIELYSGDTLFRNKLLNILIPLSQDEIVLTKSKRFKGIKGVITKHNTENDTYNLKFYKNRNPGNNDIPKYLLKNRRRGDFKVANP
tara:strand:+ start:239 stop:679 length:441 start_codon:yes stop_codon:yes gene_type:complete